MSSIFRTDAGNYIDLDSINFRSHLDWKTNGIIYGMESMGAKFIKNDDTHLYFDIPKGSTMDNKERLVRAQQAAVITPYKIKFRII